jgi:hypothetical protein
MIIEDCEWGRELIVRRHTIVLSSPFLRAGIVMTIVVSCASPIYGSCQKTIGGSRQRSGIALPRSHSE